MRAGGGVCARRASGFVFCSLELEAVGDVKVDALVGLSAADFKRIIGSRLPVSADLPAQAGAGHQGVPAGSVATAGYGLPGCPGAGVRVPACDISYIRHAQFRQEGLAIAQPTDGLEGDAHGDAP